MKARVKIIFPNNNDELKIINEYELKKFKPIEKEEDKPKKKKSE